MNDADPREVLVNQLAEEFLARYRQGERPAVQEYTEKYPEYAVQIRDLFPALVVMEQAAPASDSESASPVTAPPAIASVAHPERVGDYRILREIGRGGMGVVYEAEQEALGRRVALKVLLGPAAQDAKMLARFRRESRAAAQLHHTNIVPVFDVGQQGDLCYYAMQYIRGQALDDVVRELQRLRADSAAAAAKSGAAGAGPLAHSLWTGEFEPAGSAGATVDHEPGPGAEISESAPRPTETITAAFPDHSELSSVASNYGRYCGTVARLGLQVAQALAYAHGRGIIHRDIKPANLLLDTTGVLWVSDFGLAKTHDPALTDTGDLVGTLRYMAPERFRGECDARADVYALGLTLCELLVLRPAFDGKDRLQLVEQIGNQEPARLRVLDPRIPRDLETILMKAIEKDPRRRYASAEAMAEDLRRFLADEPIKARRIGPLERLGRWGRRNPLVAGLSAAIVLVTALGFLGVLGQWQVAVAQEQQAKNERDQVRALNEQLRSTLYAAHMNLAQHSWETGSIEHVRQLVERHRPKPGESDLRSFEWYYLDRLCHAEILTLKAHTPMVRSMVYSPDGKRLASVGGGFDKSQEVTVWDAQTGQVLLSLKGADSPAFSPDGKRLATSDGKTIKIWDAQTGQELLSFKGHSGNVRSVVFSPDGKRLASGDRVLDTAKNIWVAGQVKVWDAQTGQEFLSLKGGGQSVAFSPDGKRLASADWDDTVKVWDAQTGQELLSLKDDRVLSVAFSPDGKLLACGTGGGPVKVLDAQTGQELLALKGHRGQVNSVAFSPDSKRLASAGGDQIVRVWDAQTGQELFTRKGHTSMIWSVAFSPDGTRLASSGGGGVKVWDATTNPEARSFRRPTGGVYSLVFSPDGKRLAGASGTGKSDNAVKVCDAQTGQELLSLKGGSGRAAFSPDGKRLASAAEDKTVKVWDAQTGQELFTCKGHTGQVGSVAFSPDGKRLASTARGGEVKVWDAQTGQEFLSLHHGGGAVAFSPDGKRLASVVEGQFLQGTMVPGEVKIWDAQTGQELLTWKVNHGAGSRASLAFSPDGKRLATSSHPPNVSGPMGSGEVKVWDVHTGRELLTLQGHPAQISSVAFSPDGKRLASAAGWSGAVKVWDAQTGEELLNLKVDGWVGSLAFSPNGHWLAGDPGGTVMIWDATPLPEKP